MEKDYINHFGSQSSDYLQFRPDYPPALYEYLASLTKEHALAWDCGTGNGQAALQLAKYYAEVLGTDINQGQLAVAPKQDNIRYELAQAQKTSLLAQSVDLITVAQALHWFPLDAFYGEVKRVLKPGGVLAAWCYSLGKINPEIDAVISELYEKILGDRYWPKERRYIDARYETLSFPFAKLDVPQFTIEKVMNFAQLLGYLNTWSAVKEYEKINQENPLNMIFLSLEKAWGNTEKTYTMHWPIHLIAARIP